MLDRPLADGVMRPQGLSGAPHMQVKSTQAPRSKNFLNAKAERLREDRMTKSLGRNKPLLLFSHGYVTVVPPGSMRLGIDLKILSTVGAARLVQVVR